MTAIETKTNWNNLYFFLVFWGSHVSPVTTGDTTTKVVTKIWRGQQSLSYLISSSPFFFWFPIMGEHLQIFFFFFLEQISVNCSASTLCFQILLWGYKEVAGLEPGRDVSSGMPGLGDPRAPIWVSRDGGGKARKEGSCLSNVLHSAHSQVCSQKIKLIYTHKTCKSIMEATSFLSFFSFPKNDAISRTIFCHFSMYLTLG